MVFFGCKIGYLSDFGVLASTHHKRCACFGSFTLMIMPASHCYKWHVVFSSRKNSFMFECPMAVCPTFVNKNYNIPRLALQVAVDFAEYSRCS